MSHTPDPRHAGLARRTMITIIALAVACVAAGVTAVLAGTHSGAGPPPQPDAAAAGTPLPHTGLPRPAPTVPGPSSTTSPTNTQTPGGGDALPASRPLTLDIPAIDVHSALLDLGLNTDGTLQVPSKPLQAGWFHGSPTPGQNGPAVILGHVDAYQTGPAVFYRLGALRPGQDVRIRRADGRTVTFTIDAVRSYPKKDFPTLQVYGNTPDPELRLITCSDWNTHTHSYDGNTIVYAHLRTT